MIPHRVIVTSGCAILGAHRSRPALLELTSRRLPSHCSAGVPAEQVANQGVEADIESIDP